MGRTQKKPPEAGILRFGALLGTRYFLLEPVPDDELGNVLWFALG